MNNPPGKSVGLRYKWINEISNAVKNDQRMKRDNPVSLFLDLLYYLSKK